MVADRLEKEEDKARIKAGKAEHPGRCESWPSQHMTLRERRKSDV